MSAKARQSARERLRAEQQRQRARVQRRRLFATIGGATLFIAAVVGGGYWYMAQAGQGSNYDGPLAPQVLQDDGSVVMAADGAEAPVVEVYADFQCPVCADFEATNGGTLNELAAAGDAVVHLRPVSIFALQGEPLSGNSLRGAAAARAAADYGEYVRYSELLWENQPSEGDPGFSPAELKEWASQAGITGDDHTEFADRVDAESAAVEEFLRYLPGLMEAAQAVLSDEELATMSVGGLLAWGSDNGVEPPDLEGTYIQQTLDATAAVSARYPSGDNAFTGTPAVYVDGELLGAEAFTVRGLRDAVEDASLGEVDTKPLDDS